MEYKMLKIPAETWNRLNEFKLESEKANKWPRVSSLHNGVSVLLDLKESTVEQGGTIDLFRDRGTYGYHDEPTQGKMTFPKGIPKPKKDKKSKK